MIPVVVCSLKAVWSRDDQHQNFNQSKNIFINSGKLQKSKRDKKPHQKISKQTTQKNKSGFLSDPPPPVCGLFYSCQSVFLNLPH
jgi:hypothetical protein